MTPKQKEKSDRWFRWLLRLFPFDFRWEHGREMEQDFRARRGQEERNGGGKMSVLKLWWETLSDIARTAPREHLDMLRQDVSYALRTLRKSPGFTTVAVLTLALGIGANTTIFSFLQTVFFYPFAWEDSGKVARVYSSNPSIGERRTAASVPDLADWQAQSKTFEELAAYVAESFNFTGAGEPLRVEGLRATHNFFSMLKVEPGHGRFFLPEEDRPGGERVVVLTHKGWQKIFGGDLEILGQKISLNQEPYTVIGITPPDFQYLPVRGEQFWVPLQLDPDQSDRARRQISVVGRLRKDVTVEQARAEMSTIAQRLQQQYPETNKGWGALVIPLPELLLERGILVAILLFSPVLFVLLIACANVANLLLSRAVVREKEIGIRIALGAGRLRLIRQLLTESLLLALLGAVVGLLLAVWSMTYLKTIVAATPGISFLAQGLHPNLPVLIFTLLIALLVTVVVGIAPALRGSKADLNETLKEGGRRIGSSRHPQRLRNLFVVAEVTLAVVVMISTGLILRTAADIFTTDPGFDTGNLLTLQVSLPAYGYPEKNQVTTFYREALQKVKSLPGVGSAAITNMVPFALNRPRQPISLEGKEEPADGPPRSAEVVTVSPEYFQVIEIPLLRGRLSAEQDTSGAPPVAVISQRLARLQWPGEEVLGKRFKMGPADSKNPWITVVGVVGDFISDNLAQPPDPFIYRPHAQNPDQTMAFLARTTVDPLTLADPMRKAVWAVDENLPLYNVKTMSQALEEYGEDDKILFYLLALFALTALLLAAVGIYGVISYAVNQQTHEIGVRMALGAQPGSILRLVVGRSMLPVGVGLLLGLAGGYGIGLLLNSQVSSFFTYNEPLTFGGITLLFASIALLACWVPARRAMKVDPMVALRYE